MNKSPQSHKVKEKSAFWSSNLATKIESVLLALLFLFLPTQLGKHFWPDFSYVTGLRVDYLSPTIYTTDILIVLLLIIWLIRTKGNAVYDVFSSKWRMLIAALLIVFFSFNVFSADRFGLSLYYFVKLIEFSFLAYYIAKHIQLHLHLPVIALLFSIGVFFESFLAILQYFKQSSLDGWLYFLGERAFNGSTPGIANAAINGELLLRPYGTFSHPNVLAGYLLISIILIAFFLIPKAQGFIRIFGIVAIGLGSIALMLTLSRIAIVIYSVVVLCWFIFYFSKKPPKPRLNLGVLIFAAVLDLLIFIGGLAFLQTIITRFAQTSFFEEAVVQRNVLIGSALEIIQANPVIGVGLGHFISALAPIQDPLSVGLYLQPVHAIYLLIATETGFIGLGLFMGLMALTYLHLIRYIRLSPLFHKEFLVLALLLSVVLVIGLFDHYFLTLQQGQLLFAVILGLSWAKVRA